MGIESILMVAGTIIGVIFTFVLLARSFRRIAPPNMVYIVSGGSSLKKAYGGSVWKLPVIHTLSKLDMTISSVVIKINNVYSKAISLDYAKAATISSNIIHADTIANSNDFIGVDLRNNFGSATITKNEIYSSVSQLSIGISLQLCNYSATNPANISNNFIQVHATPSTLPTRGIKIVNSNNTNIYFNTINIIGQ